MEYSRPRAVREPRPAAAMRGGRAMKGLIADKFEPSGVEGLRAAGCAIVHEPELKDEALARRGIYVSNCPGKNAIAVAELTLALILALDRRVPENVADLRAGRWNKQEYSRARGLYGQTLGLLGAGSIAREVIRRAAAFGLHVVLWSRRFDGQDRPPATHEAP